MHSVRLKVGLVIQQPIQDIDRLIYPARNEVTEQRNVGVGHVVISNAAKPAVSQMVF